jgi:chemotaxis signal transduction protein/CheY-like chemotaxis protein
MRILLADDNPVFLQAVERFLGADSRVRQLYLVRSGAEAIELADREKPDLVLLDWSLPDVKGLWAALRITGLDETAEVWVLSPRDDPEYEQAARAAGAEGCLPRLHLFEKMGPILHNLQQRLGRRSKSPTGLPPARPAALGQEPPQESAGTRAGPPPGGAEDGGAQTVRQALADLEGLWSRQGAGLARIKEALGTESQGPEKVSRSPVGERFIVCRLGSDCCGLPAGQVARVEKKVPYTMLPWDCAPVIGLAVFEGQAIPVLGLQETVQPADAGSGSSRWVILRSGRSLAGLKVDGIDDLISVATSDCWPFPWHPAAGPRSYLTRVGRHKDRFIFLVDVDKIMADLNRA